MVYGAIDLHSRCSEVRIVDAEGRVLRERRVKTTREQLVQVMAGVGSMRVLVEASTESEWVAQALEAEGHAVVVVDPNYGPMYGMLRRRVKTDRRDVAALAEANRRGWYRAAYRVSGEQRRLRQQLAVRRRLVGMRTTLISQLRALLRQEGFRLPNGASATAVARAERLALPAALRAVLTPVLDTLRALQPLIARETRRLEQQAAAEPIVQRLQSVPGVGPLVALSFRATIVDVARFPSANHVSSSLGLVPSEDSSAERRLRGHITKIGAGAMRALLVQAAWAFWRSRRGGGTPLRQWVDAMAGRRGKRIAVVALARRLSRILYALWRDHSTFRWEPLAA
jgi:transposase